MPVCDGYECTRLIRSLDKLQQSAGSTMLPRPRIVALSAAYLDADKERAKSAGMDDFYSKPMRLSTFTAKMKEMGFLTS